MSGKTRLQEVKISENALKVLEKRYLKKDEKGKIIETPQDMLSLIHI